MKKYIVTVSTSDKQVNQAIDEICGELIVNSEMIKDGWQRRITIEEHDDDCFAHLMISVGRELQRIQ